jgi:hypothetical protein
MQKWQDIIAPFNRPHKAEAFQCQKGGREDKKSTQRHPLTPVTYRFVDRSSQRYCHVLCSIILKELDVE